MNEARRKKFDRQSEVERRIQYDYIQKYAPMLINHRVDAEYQRAIFEAGKKFPNQEQKISDYVKALEGQGRIETLCGDFCSKRKLVKITDKIIDAVVIFFDQAVNTQDSVHVQNARDMKERIFSVLQKDFQLTRSAQSKSLSASR